MERRRIICLREAPKSAHPARTRSFQYLSGGVAKIEVSGGG